MAQVVVAGRDNETDNRTVEKLPPQSVEAEEAVLGSILIDPDAVVRILPIAHPEDFYREKHGWLMEVFVALHERGEAIDHLTACCELERRGLLGEVGGPAWLTGLITATPTSTNVEHYARIVERTATLRRLISASEQIAVLGYDGGEDAVAQAQGIILGVQPRSAVGGRPLRELIEENYDRMEAIDKHGAAPGLRTGFSDLDKIFRLTGYVLVSGRPSVGKSSFVRGIANHVALYQKKRVHYFTIEDSGEMLTARWLSQASGLDLSDLIRGEVTNWDAYMKGLNTLSKLPVTVDDQVSTFPDLASRARLAVMHGGADLIVVDYLQLLRLGRRTGNKTEEVGEISKGLKALGRELGVPILAVSILSRGVDGRSDKKPQLSDLRESGQLEYDADSVLFVWRPDEENKNVANVIVAKQRNGPVGEVSLWFDGTHSRFRDATVTVTPLNGVEEL